MKKQLHEVAPRSARTVAPPAATLIAASGAVMTLDDLPLEGHSERIAESLERAVLPQRTEGATPAKTEDSPPATPVRRAKPAMKMIATPIDAELRQRVRDLRAQHEIAETFVVETALRTFFADRPLADVAADLRARGGRLRRTR